MTLGGLALAVGILVDDATVEIENIHRNLAMGKPLRQAILDGAAQIATPAFVSTLSICIVFVPIFLLTGVGGFLFTPLAMAVVFAMLASYLLSRTLVPTMVLYLLPAEERRHGEARGRASRALVSGPDRARLRRALPPARPTRYQGCSTGRSSTGGAMLRRSSPSRSPRCACSLRRPRLLPDGRRRPAAAARPLPARHAHRGDRGLFPAGRGRHPPGHSRRGDWP